MTDIYAKLINLAQKEIALMPDKDKHGWLKGKFNNFRTLQADKKGDVGEDYVVWLLEQSGRKAICTRRTDPTNKHWDIAVETDDITLEVKTATLGFSNSTFQHENLERDRNYDALVFVDIAPNTIYITFMCKHTFIWGDSHHRRTGIQHKKDLSLKWLNENGSKVETLKDFIAGYEAMLKEVRQHKSQQRGKYEI